MSVLRTILSSSAIRRSLTSPPSIFLHPVNTRRLLSTLPRLPILEAVARHDPETTAVVHSLSGRSFKYGELLGDVRRARDRLREARGREDLDGERIAFLVENSYDYVGEQEIVGPTSSRLALITGA